MTYIIRFLTIAFFKSSDTEQSFVQNYLWKNGVALRYDFGSFVCLLIYCIDIGLYICHTPAHVSNTRHTLPYLFLDYALLSQPERTVSTTVAAELVRDNSASLL